MFLLVTSGNIRRPWCRRAVRERTRRRSILRASVIGWQAAMPVRREGRALRAP